MTLPSLSSALSLLALAFVPIALVTLTSFAKITVVLSALRNALGAPDVPSGIVITGLALALSAYVMSPVVSDFERRALAAGTKASASSVDELAPFALEAVREFLSAHAGKAEQRMFVELGRERGTNETGAELSVLWPSFALSELKRAFTMAFFVFLPFFVLDLVVQHVLLAAGLSGLSPTAVALPFKLLLFVSVDGFVLLSRALILGYT